MKQLVRSGVGGPRPKLEGRPFLLYTILELFEGFPKDL